MEAQQWLVVMLGVWKKEESNSLCNLLLMTPPSPEVWTNRYAAQGRGAQRPTPWHVTLEEMRAYIGVCMMMGYDDGLGLGRLG